MDSEVTNLAQVKAFAAADYATAAQGSTADTASQPGDAITTFDGTAWRVFYTNGTGDVTELALGADGTFLKSNGAAAAPTFATPAGSGDVSKVGTPTNGQFGVWTGDGTIAGQSAATVAATLDGEDWTFTGDVDMSGATSFITGNIAFEGATVDGVRTIFSVTDPTAGRTIALGDFDMRVPAASAVNTDGTIILSDAADGLSATGRAATETLTNKDLSAASNTFPSTFVESDSAETITGAWYFSGLTNAMINVESLGTNTTASAQQVSGSYIIATAAMTLTLPTAAEGYSFCFLSGQGVTGIIGVTPATGDYIVVDGVRGTAATNYASSGAAGDKICMFAANADDWYVTSEVGTWSE